MTEIISSGTYKEVVVPPGGVLMLCTRSYVNLYKFVASVSVPPGEFQILKTLSNQFDIYKNVGLVNETLMIEPFGYSPCYYNIVSSGAGYLEDGWQLSYQPPTTVRSNSFSALTVEEIFSRIIRISNNSGVTQSVVLPSKTALDASGRFGYNGMAIEFCLINVTTGGLLPGLGLVSTGVSLADGTNCTVIGSRVVLSDTLTDLRNSSASFRLVRTNDVLYNCYRLT